MLINDINFVFEILLFILKWFVKKEIYDYGKFCKFRNRVFLLNLKIDVILIWIVCSIYYKWWKKFVIVLIWRININLIIKVFEYFLLFVKIKMISILFVW